MPDGVEPPLMLRLFLKPKPVSAGILDDLLMPPPLLVGAGLADPEAVFLVIVPVPFVRNAVDDGVTDRRDGREGVVVTPFAETLLLLAAEDLRCGMRDGVVSSVLSSDSVEPCLDGGLEP